MSSDYIVIKEYVPGLTISDYRLYYKEHLYKKFLVKRKNTKIQSQAGVSHYHHKMKLSELKEYEKECKDHDMDLLYIALRKIITDEELDNIISESYGYNKNK